MWLTQLVTKREDWKEKYQGLKEDFNAKEDELKIQRESAREKFNLEITLQGII